MKLCESCRYRNNTEYEKPCIIYRDDCKFYKKERGDMIDDLISLEDAIEVIASVDITDGTEPVFSGKQVIALLKDLDTITPQEPKTGHWIGIDEEPHEDYECNRCGYVCSTFTGNIKPHEEYKYCPNCGAKMESEDME